MRHQKKLLNGSINEKLDQVERYLRHLKTRRGNYVIGVTPPIPVFDWTQQADDQGVVFRKLMPGMAGLPWVVCMLRRSTQGSIHKQFLMSRDSWAARG